ncbi:DUF2846 domain-containing protein [Candidatus Dependentiae bacterium]|nr:DUF2846 domain-containing protein [Candidatus Dependentiae bacterium]
MFKKILQITCLFLIFLFFMGCATLQNREDNLYPDVSPGKSLVYFYRENKLEGLGLSYIIYANEEKVGRLQNGTYFLKEFEPGEYIFWAKTEVKDEVILKLEPNEIYYIKGQIVMGFFIGRPDLISVTESEGKSKIKNLKYKVIE